MRCLILLAALAPAAFLSAQSDSPPSGNEDVKRIMETFEGKGTLKDDTPPTSPQDALKKFKLREGLTIDLMASEPETEQPLFMSWDSRGRLWVTLYRQYQFPAGLKVVKYDQHLRAVFDKVPEPPPKGVKGADKVVVFEDTDGDGKYDRNKVVLDGLNIATAALKGDGGIWVLNPPYLLFYPDANDDDIPDGDPEVCLSGFGLEDTHAVANSLRFGPDGWLYGANGSTTTGNVSSKVTKNIKWEGQCIWRYHPRTHVFEIYGEGSGNPFSIEIDSVGRFFASTNATARGMHYDQGMYGEKNFGKHGPLTNPYSFGWFPHMDTKGEAKRFSQAILVYDGGLMADTLGGRYIAANSLQNLVYVDKLVPVTSTYLAEDQPKLLTCEDRWFRPVDMKVGPDGAIYMADWYDTRLSHVRPVDDWHKTSGRIYRVRPTTATMALKPFDLHKATTTELVKTLNHPERWFRNQAAFELDWRGDKSALPELEKLARDPKNKHAIDALFAIHMLGGLHDDLAVDLLKHPDPYVRRWTVRCLGDAGVVSTMAAAALKELALREEHPEVRVQILSSAKRLPVEVTLSLVRVMMERETDMTDQRIPLVLWWALESKVKCNPEQVLALFEDANIWDLKLARAYGAHHLAKRWAMAGGKENYDYCARLLALAKREQDREVVVTGIAAAFEGSKIPVLPPSLEVPLQAYLASRLDTDLALGVKTGNDAAGKRALAVISDKAAPLEQRISLIEAFAETDNKAVLPAMLTILNEAEGIPLKKAVLPLASKFDEPKLAETVLKGYEAKYAGDGALQDAAHRMLASRVSWAKLFLKEVDAWHIKAEAVGTDVVHQLGAYDDPEIKATVQKLWKPKNAALNDQQKQAEAERIKAVLRGGSGDPVAGKVLFAQRCALCHQLFSEGGSIGPDLTGYERANPDFWLTGIIAPSIEIREGFGAYVAKLKGGQVLMGILTRQDASAIALKDMASQQHTARTDELESLEASPISLMPEGLLTGLTETELRDLFAYLMKP